MNRDMIQGLPERISAMPRRSWAAVMAATGGALAAATAAVSVAESAAFGVSDASPLYLVAVVAIATVFGTRPAIVTAIGAFLLYDFLFVEPRFTVTVEDPREWLELLLFLFVGVVIGRLSALQTERAAEAARRAREAQALFRISRTLVTAPTVADALPQIVEQLVRDAEMERIWVARTVAGREVSVVSSDPGVPLGLGSIHNVLARTPGDQPARWVRTHRAVDTAAPARGNAAGELYRVRIDSEHGTFGSIWALRERGRPAPGAAETRLLSLAADQLAVAYHREQLTQEANAAEVARQSERLKSALLDSVSHDLRTPLASIRAAAGTLMDSAIELPDDERRQTAEVIDAEADRLSQLVSNLLDMSRIEAGALRPELEILDVAEVIDRVVKRAGAVSPSPRVDVELRSELPPIVGDAVYLDEALTNLIQNAVHHAPGAPIRVTASADGPAGVVVRVEDAGPGVPSAALEHLFDKFYRVARPRQGARRGLGIGLSVVKGLVEAMGGDVQVARSELGGLAFDLRLPAAPEPPSEATAA